MPNKLLFGGWAQPVEAKTAAYAVKERDCGKLFTNEGAGASVTFTLPKITTGLKGLWVEFFTVALQPLVIASNPADSLIVDSDVAADSISIGVAGAASPGQHVKVICTGTKWAVVSNPSGATGATGGATNPRAVTIVS